jgi:hypothetical protein
MIVVTTTVIEMAIIIQMMRVVMENMMIEDSAM